MKKTIILNEKEIEISISEKNMKMGNIPSFSVPSGKEFYCSQNCYGCYAKKGEKFRNCIKEANIKNYVFLEELKKIKTSLCDIALNYRTYNKVLDDFGKIINNLNCRIFRWNVYGDCDNFYFKFMLDICNNFYCKDVTFYVYSKNYNIIGAHINDIITTKNLVVNISIMDYKNTYLFNRFKGISNINFFYTFKHETEIDILEDSYNIKLNRCLNDENKNKNCIECGYCFANNYNVCNKYRNLSYKKLERPVYRIQNEKLDYYLKTFEKLSYKNVHNVFVENVLSYVTRIFNRFIDLDLDVLNILVDNLKEVKNTIKKCDTFYVACCKTFRYLYNNIDSEQAVKLAHDIIKYTIFNIYSSNNDIRLFDNNYNDLHKDVYNLCIQEIEKIKDSKFFNSAAFSISNKVYNTLITYSKYSMYYNIRRIVFSKCNLICNYYISNKLE